MTVDPFGGLQPAPEPAPPPALPHGPRPFATLSLLAVLAAFFAAELALGRAWSGDDPLALVRLGALWLPALRDGDYWRLGSYALLHWGWLHFAVNSWSLWVVGRDVELAFGPELVLGFFCTTALAAGATSAAVHSLQLHAPLVAGASGGLFGLFGASAGFLWRIRHRLKPQARSAVIRSLLSTVGINVLIAFSSRVDSSAHIGGAAAGLLLSLLAPLRGEDLTLPRRAVRLLLLGGAAALFALEGIAVASAVHPRTRTLRGPGVVAQVPNFVAPVEPGVAALPGELAIQIQRADPAQDEEPIAAHVEAGGRSWALRQSTTRGVRLLRLTAADPPALEVQVSAAGDFGADAVLRVAEDVAGTLHPE